MMAKKAAPAKTADDEVQELLGKARALQEEIKTAEKPNFKTNMSFSWRDGQTADRVNLHAESDVSNLVRIVGFLRAMADGYKMAIADIGVEAPGAFTWGGFTYEQWLHDIKLRVSKIQISAKKKKLETIETALESLISPELRRKMELDRIRQELG